MLIEPIAPTRLASFVVRARREAYEESPHDFAVVTAVPASLRLTPAVEGQGEVDAFGFAEPAFVMCALVRLLKVGFTELGCDSDSLERRRCGLGGRAGCESSS